MAYRVRDDEVKQILDTDINTTPFIETANVFINDLLSTEISEGTVSAAVLRQMELWLAAHFVSIRDKPVKSEKAGDGQVTYAVQEGKGLDATPYGQQVKAIDPTGKMATVGGKTAKLETIDFLA